MRTDVQLIQCQIEILKAMLLCEELVEYDAKWLKNAKTVVRDRSGKFASKAASIKEDVESKAKNIKEDAASIAKSSGGLLSISADAIGQMVVNPGFRKRAGLEASAMMGKSIGNLVAQAKIFPGLEKQIDKLIQEQEKKLTDIYGKDNNALAQSFRKTKLPQPSKDASFKEKLEFQAARYKAYEDTLKNPQHRTNLDDIAAIGKAAVPVAAGLGLNIAVDLVIPLLLGNPLSLGALVATSVASYAASEGASFVGKKLLDKTELNDTQKMVADIAVRVLAGAAVSGAATKMIQVTESIVEKQAAKKAIEIAEIESNWAVQESAKKAAQEAAEKAVEDVAAKKAAQEAAEKAVEDVAAKKATQERLADSWVKRELELREEAAKWRSKEQSWTGADKDGAAFQAEYAEKMAKEATEGLEKTRKAAERATKELEEAKNAAQEAKNAAQEAEEIAQKAEETAQKAEEIAQKAETAKKIAKGEQSAKEAAAEAQKILSVKAGKDWTDKNIDDVYAIFEWVDKNRNILKRNCTFSAIKSMKDRLPIIKNPVSVEALSKIDTPPVSIKMDKSELDALVGYTGNASMSNNLLRGGDFGPKIYGDDISIFHEAIGEKVLDGSLLKGGNTKAIYEKIASEIADAKRDSIGLTCRALKRLPPVENCPKFSRFVQEEQVFHNLKPGDTFVEPGFMSCSTIIGDFEEVLGNSADPKNFPINFIIKPKPQSYARDVSSISLYPEQKEVLYPPGAKFTVESVEMVDGKKIITMLEN